MQHHHHLLAAIASTLVAACGSGTGTIALELTDAPPDLETLQNVYVTIGAVEVHVVDKGDESNGDFADESADHRSSWRTVSRYAGSFDLLALQNDVTAPLGELQVPEGKITQIRLHVDPLGDNYATLTTGERCELDLRNVDQTGIKINHPFKAIELREDETARIVVDFDVKESIDQLGICELRLDPVIKIKKAEVEID